VRRSNSTSLRTAFDCSLLALFLLPCMHGASQQRENSLDLVGGFEKSQYFWQQLQVAQKLVELNDSKDLLQLEPYLRSDDRHLRGNAAFVFAGLVRLRLIHGDSGEFVSHFSECFFALAADHIGKIDCPCLGKLIERRGEAASIHHLQTNTTS
jgi:hypothetical protein